MRERKTTTKRNKKQEKQNISEFSFHTPVKKITIFLKYYHPIAIITSINGKFYIILSNIIGFVYKQK